MRLRAARSDTSVERALYTLKAVQLHRVELGTRTLRRLTKMSKTQLQLFEYLEVRKPAAGAV